MGYMRHHAIVVTGYEPDNHDRVADAYGKAVSLGLNVSNVIESPVNGYRSFLVAPDGSKEGWDDSDAGDKRRDAFVDWLRSLEDGWLAWAEVRYGDDDGQAAVIRGSDKNLSGMDGR